MKSLTQYIKEKFLTNEEKYSCLNQGRSCYGLLAKGFQGCNISKDTSKILWSSMITEGIDYEPEETERGGIIVFSTDVNAIKLSDNKLVNWFKQKTQTVLNRFGYTSKIDKIAQKNNLVGWTIGKYLTGRYTAKNGKAYGENSLSVELIGISSDRLINIAEELCKEFNQESVLVKDYSSGRILFVNPD